MIRFRILVVKKTLEGFAAVCNPAGMVWIVETASKTRLSIVSLSWVIHLSWKELPEESNDEDRLYVRRDRLVLVE